MTISKELMQGYLGTEIVEVENGAILTAQIEYSAPHRTRNAVTTLMWRVQTDYVPEILEEEADRDQLRTAGFSIYSADTNGGQPIIAISPRIISETLSTYFTNFMVGIQTNKVKYRRVGIKVSRTVAFDENSNVSSADYPEKAANVEVRKFKCGEITGAIKGVDTNHKALAFLLYGKELANTADKPSRVLISGVALTEDSDYLENPAVINLYTHLKLVLPIAGPTVGRSFSFTMTPVVHVANKYREVATIQIEGISNVAGSGKQTN